jgi:hypothetical protein
MQVTVGKKGANQCSVVRTLRAEPPEGSILNGMIMEPERFVAFLRDFWKEQGLSKRHVTLVAYSTKFVGQILELPRMSDARTRAYIRREFVDIDRDEERVHGYIRLAGAKPHFQRLYAESISPELIRDYLNIFAQAGIRLNAIYSGESSMINLVQTTYGQAHDAFVLQIAGSMTFMTLLFINGAYVYHSGIRSFYEQGTPEYAGELARALGQIDQFVKVNHLGSLPGRLVLSGTRSEDTPLYGQHFKEAGFAGTLEEFSSSAITLQEGAGPLQQYLFSISGLFDNQTFGDYKRLLKGRRPQKEAPARKRWPGVVIVAAVMLVLWLASALYAMGIRAERDDLLEENSAQALSQQLAYEQALEEENEQLIGQYMAVGGICQNLGTYPQITSSVLKALSDCAGDWNIDLSGISYDADSGVLTLIVSTASEDLKQIRGFVEGLRQLELFEDLDYTGYSYQGDGQYELHVTGILSGSAGREVGP